MAADTQGDKPLALQMNGFSAPMEAQLAQLLEVVRWFDLTAEEQRSLLKERGHQVRVVTAGGHVGCPPELMRQLPALGLVALNGVGTDKVSLPLARERGVGVTTTPDTLADDVADLAIGLMIALKRRIPAADAHVRAGHWPDSEMPLARKVTGSRMGIFGLGAIGSAIAQRARGFGEVGYASRSGKPVDYRRFDSLSELAAWADVLFIAAAATQETAGAVDAEVLQALGSSGVLVNISRGSVVEEAALIAALEDGVIAGAGLDVFIDEPRVPEALRRLPNTVLTPHIASATVETRAAMADLVLGNIRAFLAGKPLVTPVQ
ncbi:2-hydroxyacid dehydrogenase [Croceibacterium xixiisoli]|nr:2-hydroxyacid dehydrogenase [Croceibacterium xixiisoli]